MQETIPATWRSALASEFHKPYWKALGVAVTTAYEQNVVYPPREQVFAALEHIAPADVRVVILGQDPYHGAGQAMGLAFSVSDGTAIPPSLRNIHTEITNDTGTASCTHGDLTPWAQQGVLLLNTTLTVEAGVPASHTALGWEEFTDAIIDMVAETNEHVVFLLWGKHAQEKGARIDTTKHAVFTAPHPSPLSAYRGFLGCRHFSATNEYLRAHGKTPIRW